MLVTVYLVRTRVIFVFFAFRPWFFLCFSRNRPGLSIFREFFARPSDVRRVRCRRCVSLNSREMAQDHQNVEMQDKVDGGCLSPADEEREPCLKESAAAESAADKNNGTVSGAAAATAAAVADEKKPLDNNNGNGTIGSGGHKFYAFAAATSLEQKLRDKTGFSRTGLVVAGVAVLLFLILLCTQVITLIMWPRPPRVFPVCRSVSCLRASAEVSLPFLTFGGEGWGLFYDFQSFTLIRCRDKKIRTLDVGTDDETKRASKMVFFLRVQSDNAHRK